MHSDHLLIMKERENIEEVPLQTAKEGKGTKHFVGKRSTRYLPQLLIGQKMQPFHERGAQGQFLNLSSSCQNESALPIKHTFNYLHVRSAS